jgi:hypothetical protein
MKNIFQEKYSDFLNKVVNDIINAGKKISTKLFDDLDKETTLNIYSFLSTNRSTLHINQEILLMLRDIVVKKYNNVEIYKLNPSIDDLLDNNLYKLYINNELFLVPLWHNECYFDTSNCEIIVFCEPELPENISIDDDNNLIIEEIINIDSYLQKNIEYNKSLQVKIGNHEENILLSELHLVREQYYRIKNKGLSKIKKNIYDVSEKSDIIVKVMIK